MISRTHMFVAIGAVGLIIIVSLVYMFVAARDQRSMDDTQKTAGAATITGTAQKTKDGYYIGEYILLGQEIEKFNPEYALTDYDGQTLEIVGKVRQVDSGDCVSPDGTISQCREGVNLYLYDITSFKPLADAAADAGAAVKTDTFTDKWGRYAVTFPRALGVPVYDDNVDWLIWNISAIPGTNIQDPSRIVLNPCTPDSFPELSSSLPASLQASFERYGQKYKLGAKETDISGSKTVALAYRITKGAACFDLSIRYTVVPKDKSNVGAMLADPQAEEIAALQNMLAVLADGVRLTGKIGTARVQNND